MHPTRGRSLSAPPQLSGSGQAVPGPLPSSPSLNNLANVVLQNNQTEFDQNHLVAQQEQLSQTTDAERRNHLRAEAEARIALRQSYKKAVDAYHTKANAATAIQAQVRSYLARKEFLAQKEAATTLQAIVRGRLARKEFEKQKEAVLTLQSAVRGHQARQEYDQLVQRRDQEITDLRLYLQQRRLQLDGRVNQAVGAFPYDALLPSLPGNIYSAAAGKIDSLVTGREWDGYALKLEAIKTEFQSAREKVLQRIEIDAACYQDLKANLVPKAKVASVAQLDAKLLTTSSKTGWETLKALCSAEQQNITEILDLAKKLSQYYEEPVVATKQKKAFNREDPNTWVLNPVSWHTTIQAVRGRIENIPQWNAVYSSIQTGSLTGRTKTKGSVMKTDWVMHEHVSGSYGVGFCYLHEDDDTVTPWILDFAFNRPGTNEYDWERGGHNHKGDPAVALPPKKT